MYEKGDFVKLYLKCQKRDVLTGNLYLFSCKKGVKIAANVLETTRKRVYFLTWVMIMCYVFE